MATIEELKELEAPETPLFLFDCTLTDGRAFHWSTHKVTVNQVDYSARVMKHNLVELGASAGDATDGVSKLTITLANSDSLLSPIERTTGWKGAQLTVNILFFNLGAGHPASNSQVLFRGVANPPEESTEQSLRLSFGNRLSLKRIFLPETRIQKRCPWTFPTNASQLREAVDGGVKSTFSPFYNCGYSAGLTGGVGNLSGGTQFTSCDYSRTHCDQRGMFDKDSAGNLTRRFGGIEFVPASILVRSYGEKGSHVSLTLDNQARYNDFVPLIYGTGWYTPPIVFARNDGNLTHTEVLLGSGPMTAVNKVIVNGVEIPEGVAGANMTATGWYNVITLGARTGSFNPDFKDSTGKPAGDPYGSLACLSVVVPNRISDGRSLPQIEVLAQGVAVERFDASVASLGDAFTNNSAWVLLDVLRRSGWDLANIDLPSFVKAVAACDAPIPTTDLHGNSVLAPRYQCNLLLTNRRSAADIVRGIRTGAGLYVNFNASGLIQVNVEDTLAAQQPAKPAGSNSTGALNGGWPAYEFGDNQFSGILRRANGQPAFRTYARSSADSPNFLTVEFQDEFNEYQQDSLSLVDLDDQLAMEHDVTASVTALGLPNFDQANRITALTLSKSIRGNTYVEFDTSVRAVNLRPGDLITVTYAKEGWDRQPFRVVQISPAANYRTATIRAQIHDDAWYAARGNGSSGSGRQPTSGVGLPRPLVGATFDDGGKSEFDITESVVASTDGSVNVELSVGFVQPILTQSTSMGIPLVGLNAQTSSTGGTLPGGQSLYYGLTAVDASGAESALSFLVKAVVPAGTATNTVTLLSLSFPKTAARFNVYRGTNPAQLLQIGSQVALSSQFVDRGLKSQLMSPPDINYDHANFYWRLELQPEEGVDKFSALTIGNSKLHMLANDYMGGVVRITKGTGAGQERIVAGNDATTITVTSPWSVVPDATSFFVVSDSSWQFGATGATSPATFVVPNREGATVQISGRSANVRNEESAYELSPLTRWQIAGGAGSTLDSDVPPGPNFAIAAIGQGTVEVQGVSFGSYTNTRSVSAGTLTLGYWDETSGRNSLALAADIDAAAAILQLSAAISAQAGDLFQVGSEIVVAQQAVNNGTALSVSRAGYGTTAASHSTGMLVFPLQRKTFVMAFARDFFGSLASGSFAYPAFLPDVRIATVEMFVTNSQGNSDVTRKALTASQDSGLRTLSGGQFTIQVDGMLAIQQNAAPPLVVETTLSVRDVFATVGTAPTGAAIELEVTADGNQYCTLTIPAGSTSSDAVDGFGLGPVTAKSLLGLNITSVPQTGDATPGSNLTVTIRL